MKKSFTLIELIVVIAIIAILAAIIAPNAFRAIEKAKISTAIGNLKTFKNAAEALYTDTGHWPVDGNINGLRIDNANCPVNTNSQSWDGWDGPYLGSGVGATPWSGTYWFEGWLNFPNGPNNSGTRELYINFDDYCFDGSGSTCGVPFDSAQKIDEMIDDGNLSTGTLMHGLYTAETDGDLAWIIQEDLY